MTSATGNPSHAGVQPSERTLADEPRRPITASLLEASTAGDRLPPSSFWERPATCITPRNSRGRTTSHATNQLGAVTRITLLFLSCARVYIHEAVTTTRAVCPPLSGKFPGHSVARCSLHFDPNAMFVAHAIPRGASTYAGVWMLGKNATNADASGGRRKAGPGRYSTVYPVLGIEFRSEALMRGIEEATEIDQNAVFRFQSAGRRRTALKWASVSRFFFSFFSCLLFFLFFFLVVSPRVRIRRIR